MTELGRLERVDLRQAWVSESGDFTPWLARPENIGLLGEAIGMDLEIEGTEADVGPFRADIICKDIATDQRVLIENQLERTDHSHLGQVITYAAGLDALAVVWVAAKFTEEHRAALDWLNEVTNETTRFFGLEIELWRIGNSTPAPKFNVVSAPNDWSKVSRGPGGVGGAGELGETKRSQLDFWSAFAESLRGRVNFAIPSPRPCHYMRFSAGRSGFSLIAVAARWDQDAYAFSGVLRVELTIRRANAQHVFTILAAEKDKIEAEIGEKLSWDNVPEKDRYRIYVRKQADLDDRNAWPQQHEWLKKNLEAFQRVLGPRIKALNLDAVGAEVQQAVDDPLG